MGGKGKQFKCKRKQEQADLSTGIKGLYQVSEGDQERGRRESEAGVARGVGKGRGERGRQGEKGGQGERGQWEQRARERGMGAGVWLG